MPFPPGRVIDSGAGADANPAGGIWTTPFYADPGAIKRLSNSLRGANAAGAFNGAYHNARTERLPIAWFHQLNPLPAAGDVVWLWAASGTLGSAPDGYGLTYQHGSTGARPFQFYKAAAGAQTRLSPASHTIPAPLALNDWIGWIMDKDGNWQCWYQTGGAWTLDHSSASPDTSFAGPFNLALELQNTTAGVINLTGGQFGGLPSRRHAARRALLRR